MTQNMARLKYMTILRTTDNQDLAEKIYSGIRKLVKEDYDSMKLGDEESRDVKYFLANNKLGTVEFKRFPNNELKSRIIDSVREMDTYFIHAFSGYDSELDPNIGYIKLFLAHDALWRASPRSIVDVLPFVPYLRQDRKDEPRVPISADCFANLTKVSAETKLTRILTLDMHANQEQAFYKVSSDAFGSVNIFAYCINHTKLDKSKMTIVSPDAGGVPRAKILRDALKLSGSNLAMITKERPEAGEASVLYVVGNVKEISVIVDDLIDSGGTVIKASEALRERGAKEIYVCAAHAILSQKDNKKAEEKLLDAGIKLITTDTISRKPEYYKKNKDWMTCISVAPFFADAIYNTQLGRSSTPLFDAEYVSKLYSKFSEEEIFAS